MDSKSSSAAHLFLPGRVWDFLLLMMLSGAGGLRLDGIGKGRSADGGRSVRVKNVSRESNRIYNFFPNGGVEQRCSPTAIGVGWRWAGASN